MKMSNIVNTLNNIENGRNCVLPVRTVKIQAEKVAKTFLGNIDKFYFMRVATILSFQEDSPPLLTKTYRTPVQALDKKCSIQIKEVTSTKNSVIARRFKETSLVIESNKLIKALVG